MIAYDLCDVDQEIKFSIRNVDQENYLLVSSLMQGNNAQIGYSLEGEQDNVFIITTVNSLGYIFVNGSLDYDAKNFYRFSVSTDINLQVGDGRSSRLV